MKKILIILSFLVFISGCYNKDISDTRHQIEKAKLDKIDIETKSADLNSQVEQKKSQVRDLEFKINDINEKKRLEQLRNNIAGTYKVGNTSCTIYEGKELTITWSNGKSYDKLYFETSFSGYMRTYLETDKYGSSLGRFTFATDYLKGSYLRNDGAEFTVDKIIK
jgi:hypothetical protein